MQTLIAIDPELIQRIESILLRLETKLDRLSELEYQRPLHREELLEYLDISDRQLLEYRRQGLPTYGSRGSLIAFRGEVDEWLKKGVIKHHRRFGKQ